MSLPLIPLSRRVLGGATVPAVNARDLHVFLEVATRFDDWIRKRIEDFGFQEGTDFEVFLNSQENPQGGRPAKEYALTLGMAKELAMVERNDRGKQARLYFLECERQAQDPVHCLLTMSRPEMLELAAGLAREKQALATKVQAQAEDLAAASAPPPPPDPLPPPAAGLPLGGVVSPLFQPPMAAGWYHRQSDFP